MTSICILSTQGRIQGAEAASTGQLGGHGALCLGEVFGWEYGGVIGGHAVAGWAQDACGHLGYPDHGGGVPMRAVWASAGS